MSRQLRTHPTIGVCGLDCGLCPRYYTVGASRCPRCGGPDFFSKHPSCSFITCCVKRKGLEVCAECPEFPCRKFKDAKTYESLETLSYPPGRKIIPNLRLIRARGIREFMKQQRKRIRLLERMIEGFDDGRSRRLFCRAAALLTVRSLVDSLKGASRIAKKNGFGSADKKKRADVIKGLLNAASLKEKINLRPKSALARR